MERRYLFAAIAAFALTALCLSYFDIGLSFSERYIWWDSLEHVLGGVTVGFVALFLATLSRISNTTFFAVLSALCVGLAWEIMEAQTGIGTSLYLGYAADTIKDLVCDCIGGYIAVYIGHLMRHV
jgi:VanZ family protein